MSRRKTCALYGYPGVSFVSGVGGSQIGKDAARDRTAAPKVVTLAPGQRGSFALRVVDAGSAAGRRLRPGHRELAEDLPAGEHRRPLRRLHRPRLRQQDGDDPDHPGGHRGYERLMTGPATRLIAVPR